MLDGGHCSLSISLCLLLFLGNGWCIENVKLKLVWSRNELQGALVSVCTRPFVCNAVERTSFLASKKNFRVGTSRFLALFLSLFFLGGDCDAWVIR